MWFAGIDWADKHHDVVVLDAEGQRLSTRRYLHSAEGLASLTADLRTLGASPEEVVCVVEMRQGLLIAALLEAGLWGAPVNPKTVDRTRPASGAKSDPLDALLLARAGRRNWPDLRRLQPDSPLVAELKALRRDQASLIRQQTRLVNQLIACLKAYYPVALALVDKLTRPVAQALLTAFPTLEEARAASEEEVERVLRTAHCPSSAQKATRFRAILHRAQLVASPALVHAKARYALALVAQLALIHRQLLDCDRAIGDLFRQHEASALFASLPGAGRRLAPRLFAAWGEDRTRFSSAAQVQALAGTAPVVVQSGASGRGRQRTGCVKPLRAALYQLARESLLFEGWAGAY
jgi:transposase